MPARITEFPPAGWQVVRRAEGHYLQRQREDGSWIDVAGPYKQRGTALNRYRILESRRILALRKANPRDARLPEHRFADPSNQSPPSNAD